MHGFTDDFPAATQGVEMDKSVGCAFILNADEELCFFFFGKQFTFTLDASPGLVLRRFMMCAPAFTKPDERGRHSPVHVNAEFDPALFDRPENLEPFYFIHGEGLFAKDMLSGFRGGRNDWEMDFVRRRDLDEVDLWIVDDIHVIICSMGYVEGICRRLCRFFADVATPLDRGVWIGCEIWEVLRPRKGAATDLSNLESFHADNYLIE